MTIDSLKALYLEELQDLYSANNQMKKVAAELKAAASNGSLQNMLGNSEEKIQEHNSTLKSIVEAHGERANDEHCKGMEGLVQEARKHALEQDIPDAAVRDAAIISQVQRMSHYGLAGYGTAHALALTLGLQEDASKLNRSLDEIYEGDRYLSHIAESTVNEDAA